MDKLTQQSLTLLLKRAGLEPKEGDLERFGHLIEQYLERLKLLHSADLEDEEIATSFNPEWNQK